MSRFSYRQRMALTPACSVVSGFGYDPQIPLTSADSVRRRNPLSSADSIIIGGFSPQGSSYALWVVPSGTT
jgi:hypothetical protein